MTANQRTTFVMLGVLLLAGMAALWGVAQSVPRTGSPAFLTFRCDFVRETNQARVTAVLSGPTGQPVPEANYSIQAAVEEGGLVLEDSRVSAANVDQHRPLNIIIVLDITETVPLPAITEALQAGLLTDVLPAADQVAVLPFGSRVELLSPFLTDKNQLLAEYIQPLDQQRGSNVLYDAVLQAVLEFEDRDNSGAREIVLVLTDSGRRSDDQPEIDEIITRANQADIQLYTIGFSTRLDRPDIIELSNLADRARGYSWIYDDEEANTPDAIRNAVEGFLREFARALDAEITISIDMQGRTPDADGRVRFDLAAQLPGQPSLQDAIRCPFERLTHNIAFVAPPDAPPTVTEAFDAQVTFNTELSAEEVLIEFWLDDGDNLRKLRSGDATVYTVDPAQLPPGLYTLWAELRNAQDDILASTDRNYSFFVQQPLEMSVSVGDTAAGEASLTCGSGLPASSCVLRALDAPVTFRLTSPNGVTLPPVRVFMVRGSPAVTRDLATVPFAEGVASIPFDNGLRDLIETNFSDIDAGETVQLVFSDQSPLAPTTPNLVPIQAQIEYQPLAPPASPDDSDQTPQAPQQTGVIPAFVVSIVGFALTLSGISGNALAALIVLGLLILNLLMLASARRWQIRRYIHKSNKDPLDERLMTVTVVRNGLNHPFPLTKNTMSVGRGGNTNDINLGDNPAISRRHGYFLWRDGRWWYTNAKRTARAYVDGRRTRGLALHPLEPVMEIEVAGVQMFFHDSNLENVADYMRTDLNDK